MSDFGLLVRNDSGQLVINGDYRNLRLFEEGTIPDSGPINCSCSDGVSGSYLVRKTFTARSTPPLALFQPGNLWVGFAYVTDTNDEVGLLNPAGNGPVPYALLDMDGVQKDSENFGMKVWDVAGEVAFDSRYRYLKIVDVIEFDTTGFSLGTAYSVSHAPASNAYYLVSSLKSSAYATGPICSTEYINLLSRMYVRQKDSTTMEWQVGTVFCEVGSQRDSRREGKEVVVVAEISN